MCTTTAFVLPSLRPRPSSSLRPKPSSLRPGPCFPSRVARHRPALGGRDGGCSALPERTGFASRCVGIRARAPGLTWRLAELGGVRRVRRNLDLRQASASRVGTAGDNAVADPHAGGFATGAEIHPGDLEAVRAPFAHVKSRWAIAGQEDLIPVPFDKRGEILIELHPNRISGQHYFAKVLKVAFRALQAEKGPVCSVRMLHGRRLRRTDDIETASYYDVPFEVASPVMTARPRRFPWSSLPGHPPQPRNGQTRRWRARWSQSTSLVLRSSATCRTRRSPAQTRRGHQLSVATGLGRQQDPGWCGLLRRSTARAPPLNTSAANRPARDASAGGAVTDDAPARRGSAVNADPITALPNHTCGGDKRPRIIFHYAHKRPADHAVRVGEAHYPGFAVEQAWPGPGARGADHAGTRAGWRDHPEYTCLHPVRGRVWVLGKILTANSGIAVRRADALHPEGRILSAEGATVVNK